MRQELRTGVLDEGPPRSEIQSFEAFYAAHFQAVTVQMFAYTSDLAAAQDVAQEAFCRALARWVKVSTMDDPVAWVRRVAWNLATSRWRRARTATLYAIKQRPETVDEPSPDRVALAAALATLPANHRRAVILHYLADMAVLDIATQEGVTENTVKSWLHRGRGALAAYFKEEGGNRG